MEIKCIDEMAASVLNGNEKKIVEKIKSLENDPTLLKFNISPFFAAYRIQKVGKDFFLLSCCKEEEVTEKNVEYFEHLDEDFTFGLDDFVLQLKDETLMLSRKSEMAWSEECDRRYNAYLKEIESGMIESPE